LSTDAPLSTASSATSRRNLCDLVDNVASIRGFDRIRAQLDAVDGLMIVVESLVKAFGRHRDIVAVNGVTFTALDGAITGLLGPNGAGKTTLLRMLATLIPPDAGRATIDGHDIVTGRAKVRNRIGVLSDARGLYVRLTARENIRYYARLHGLGGARLETRIDGLLQQLGLIELADRRAQGFSQGERMKVAIARALVHDPSVILLDEPTNGLDIMSIRALRDLLRKLRTDGKCILFSTHVMQEVAALCDTIVIVGHGRVVADGSGAQLLRDSAQTTLEDAFVTLLGSGEGLAA
jgi:sodium transport system ATP-binding protein